MQRSANYPLLYFYAYYPYYKSYLATRKPERNERIAGGSVEDQ